MAVKNIDSLLGTLLVKKPVTATDIPEDHETLLHRADWHGITPLLFHILSKTGNWNIYPRSLRESLESRHTRAIAANLFIENELQSVYRLLNENKMDYLIFKGVPLSHLLYLHPHLRVCSDTDILFPDKDTVLKAADLLAQVDYTRPNAVSGELLSKQICCYKSGKTDFTHALDLHWEVNNHPAFAGLFPFNELEARSQQLDIDGKPACPSAVDNMLLACMHRVAHIPHGEGNRLIWLYDIHLLSNSFTGEQWDAFVRMSVNKRLAAVCLDSLLKTREHLGTQFPEHVVNELEKHIHESVLVPEYQQNRLQELLQTLRTLPGWKSRLQYVTEMLFPDREYMLQKYHVQNQWLLPWLYLKRAVAGGVKMFK